MEHNGFTPRLDDAALQADSDAFAAENAAAAGDARAPQSGYPSWARAFLDGLRAGGTVRYACARAGITRRTAEYFKRQNATFAADWRYALDDYADLIIGKITQLAMERGEKDMLRLAAQIYLPEIFGRVPPDTRRGEPNILVLNTHEADELRSRLAAKLLPPITLDAIEVPRDGNE